MKSPAFAVAGALLSVLGSAAIAQTVYRCGAEGRVYSQTPCNDGRVVEAADPRSDEQRAAAERVARADDTAGKALERERHAREASPVMAGSLGPGPAPEKSVPATKSKKTKKKKKSANADFGATTPAVMG